MSLTGKDVDGILRMLEASRFDRLYLEMDGVKLELSSNGAATSRPAAATGSEQPRPAPASSPDSAASRPAPVARARQSAEAGLVEVKSPLLGVYYHAPKPGEPPFVEAGSKVEEDTVIGIIEVMKLMNSARAGVKGEVVEILVPNGELVEHGEVLMLVRPEG